jgi:hypothetical protein
MSFAAVYNVTRGLRMLLRSQLILVSPTAVVTLLPPGVEADTRCLPGVVGRLFRTVSSPAEVTKLVVSRSVWNRAP